MPKTVMFVDDDDAFLEIAQRACRRLPYIAAVLTATDGARGLTVLEERVRTGGQVPNMVFVDINMPVLDGFGFLRGLAALRANHSALRDLRPVATLTSSDQERDRKLAAELGADAYIVKGSTLAETVEAIARMVE